MNLYLLSGSLVNVFYASNEAILLLDVYMVAIMKNETEWRWILFHFCLTSVTIVEYLLSQRPEQLCFWIFKIYISLAHTFIPWQTQ